MPRVIPPRRIKKEGGSYKHYLPRGFGWTKEEYDAAPDAINRLHVYILDLEEEVRRIRNIADEYSAELSGTTHHRASIKFAVIAQRLDWIIKGCEVRQRA